MGGLSKKPTIGYKNFMSMAMVLGHGPFDYIRQIKAGEKTIWLGRDGGSEIEVDEPDALGGDKKGGGYAGKIRVKMGYPDQVPNSHLEEHIPGLIPAFRGVVMLILKSFYLGTQPSLQPWKVQGQRIYVAEDGEDQWYKDKAGISQGRGVVTKKIKKILPVHSEQSLGQELLGSIFGSDQPLSSVIGLLSYRDGLTTSGSELTLWTDDMGGELVTPFSGTIEPVKYKSKTKEIYLNGDQQRLEFTPELWRNPIHVAIAYKPYGKPSGQIMGNGSTVIYQGRFSEGDMSTEINLNGGDASFVLDGTEYVNGVDTRDALATAFNGNEILTVRNSNYPDGQLSFGRFSNSVYSLEIGVYAMLFYTDIADEEAAIKYVRQYIPFAEVEDMNPAHILRETLTNTEWGLGESSGEIDNVKFMEIADTLFDEKFGISLFWSKQGRIEDFIQLVLNHIDCFLFIHTRTGLWTPKLVRDDYDINDLLVIDESNVVDWGDLERRKMADAINQVTAIGVDGRDGKPLTMTEADTALVYDAGGVPNDQTVNYDGIQKGSLLSRVLVRDLLKYSSELLSGHNTVNRIGEKLNPGDPFILNSPRRKIFNEVMRCLDVELGDGRSNEVELAQTSDIYRLDDTAISSEPVDRYVDPINDPESCVDRMVVEAPYYEHARGFGDADAIAGLTVEPDLGYVMATAAAPTPDAFMAELNVNSGAGYEANANVNFCPVATLTMALTSAADNSVATIENLVGRDEIQVGQLAIIGSEMVRVDSVLSTGIVLGRGCLDTVPAEHNIGDKILFWLFNADSDGKDYVLSDVLNVQLLTTTSRGVLDTRRAPIDVVEMNSRAIRPYPVGNLTVDGSFTPGPFDGSVEIAWAHRDRLVQTTGIFEDHTYGDIGPEAGTTYTLDVEALDSAGASLGVVETFSKGSATSHSYIATIELGDPVFGSIYADIAALKFQVTATRDGYDNWQSASIVVALPVSVITVDSTTITADSTIITADRT